MVAWSNLLRTSIIHCDAHYFLGMSSWNIVCSIFRIKFFVHSLTHFKMFFFFDVASCHRLGDMIFFPNIKKWKNSWKKSLFLRNRPKTFRNSCTKRVYVCGKFGNRTIICKARINVRYNTYAPPPLYHVSLLCRKGI